MVRSAGHAVRPGYPGAFTGVGIGRPVRTGQGARTHGDEEVAATLTRCRGRGWHGGSRPAPRTAAAGSACSGAAAVGSAAGRGPAGQAHGGRLAAHDAAARRRPVRRSPSATARPRRCASACWATPRRPGQGVHRARQTPGALLASGLAAVAERPGGAAQRRAARRPVRRPGPPGRSCCWRTGAPAAGRLRDHDRRERRHPPDAAHRVGAPSVRGGTPAAHGGLRRSSSAPARTWARSSRSTSRCAGWPAGSRASWRPRRPSAWSSRAGARSRWATCWARSSRRTRGSCSARTTTTRRRRATPRRRWRCCRRCARALGLWPEADRPERVPPRGHPAGGAGRRRGGLRGGYGGHGRARALGPAQAPQAPAAAGPDVPTAGRRPARRGGPGQRRVRAVTGRARRSARSRKSRALA